MFGNIKNQKGNLLARRDFEEKKMAFEATARKRVDKFYGVALPKEKNKSGVLYAPNGMFQIIDFMFMSSGMKTEILESAFEGDVLTCKEMEQLMQSQDFLEIQLNIDSKHGGACIEEMSWILNTDENSSDWIYLLLKVVSNISMKQLSNFVIFYEPKSLGFNSGLSFIRLDDEGYGLLRNALSRAHTRGE